MGKDTENLCLVEDHGELSQCMDEWTLTTTRAAAEFEKKRTPQ